MGFDILRYNIDMLCICNISQYVLYPPTRLSECTMTSNKMELKWKEVSFLIMTYLDLWKSGFLSYKYTDRALKPVSERGVKRHKHMKGNSDSNSMLEALLHFGGHLCLRKDVPPKCTLHSQTNSRLATQGHVRTSQQSLAGTVI